jgi:hypothetical protein
VFEGVFGQGGILQPPDCPTEFAKFLTAVKPEIVDPPSQRRSPSINKVSGGNLILILALNILYLGMVRELSYRPGIQPFVQREII